MTITWFGRAGLAVSAMALGLAGCGGGGSVDVAVTPAAPAFDVGAQIDGVPIAHFDVLPGDSETVSVVAGDTFELDSDGAVLWDFSVGGSADIPAQPGGAIVYGDATVNETLVGDSRLVVSVDSSAPPGTSIPVTIYITSQDDPTQYAAIDLVINS
ncbi:MAG: hypothetical protein ACTHL8_17490 [Burkholderiaceae bacterium]